MTTIRLAPASGTSRMSSSGAGKTHPPTARVGQISWHKDPNNWKKKHSFTSTTGTKTYQNHGFTVFHFILFGKNIRSHGTKTHHKWFNGRRSAMEASKDKPARFGTQSWKVTKEKIQSFEVLCFFCICLECFWSIK